MSLKSNKPPSSNTGVQNTEEEGLRACIDWVQVTLKIDDIKQLIIDILGLSYDSFSLDEKGQYGYRKSARYGSIVVYYDGGGGMGVHLQMSGQGCREYELYATKTWKKLFEDLLKSNAKFSRLDLAIDDFKGYFKIPSLVRKIKNGELVSKFKSARRMETIEILNGSSKGTTIYYGSAKSEIQIRMYEKKHEMEGKGVEVAPEIQFWNRTEIQARNDRATQMARLIISKEDGEEPIGEIVKGVLMNYISFRVRGADSNKSRWKVAPFWDKFLGDVDKLKLTKVSPERTVQKTFRWLDNQVSKSMAVIWKATGGNMDIFQEFIENGLERMGKKEKDMLERFFKDNPLYEAVAKSQEEKNSIKKGSHRES